MDDFFKRGTYFKFRGGLTGFGLFKVRDDERSYDVIWSERKTEKNVFHGFPKKDRCEEISKERAEVEKVLYG